MKRREFIALFSGAAANLAVAPTTTGVAAAKSV